MAQLEHIAAFDPDILNAEKLRIDHWRDKEATRDGVRVAIHGFLYSDRTGLPVDRYTGADVEERTDAVNAHVYRVYAALPSPFCGAVAA